MSDCVPTWAVVPYGGVWSYVDPRTHVKIRGRDRTDLMKQARDHARANNLPIGLEFEQQIEQWVCDSTPQLCKPCGDMPLQRSIQLTRSDVIRGTKVMTAFMLSGRELVDTVEANRRAAICWACPMKTVFKVGCTGLCAGLREIVNAAVGDRDTEIKLNDQACGVCHCWLRVAVWLPLSTQCHGVNDNMRNEFATRNPNCWKRC